ncbi:MAG: CorA family divalent cation transporter [Eubacteriales bacterium]|nr:CorA family divalent cation transporter [Eubacteriales bacterium]
MKDVRYVLGERLEEIREDRMEYPFASVDVPSVFLTNSRQAGRVMMRAGIVYEGEIKLNEVEFCRLEPQQECLAGALSIPRLMDVLGSRYKILFFINKNNIVIIDDDDFSHRLIQRVQRRKSKQGETKEHFIYNFILEFISRDVEILGQYEKRLMELEERVMHGQEEGFQSKFMPIRRELLVLRGYYDEMMDMGKELEENENGFFARKQLKYFGTITDRADRLMTKTSHLLEYAQQIRDAYQAAVDARQNRNMELLTVISTIFFPLTLITGWYGMNFQNMPELENGYPGVIALSVIVIVFCIWFFKRKKML